MKKDLIIKIRPTDEFVCVTFSEKLDKINWDYMDDPMFIPLNIPGYIYTPLYDNASLSIEETDEYMVKYILHHNWSRTVCRGIILKLKIDMEESLDDTYNIIYK